MSDFPESIPPSVAMVATIIRHCAIVKDALSAVSGELDRRARVHDLSKWTPEELPGFVEINATARVHPYGSEEYKAALDAQRPTIDRHTSSNSHHPEYHNTLSDMGFLDIIEMVCDWWSASRTYGTTDWAEVLGKQKSRFNFTTEQWWLIEQVATFLEESHT